MLINYYSISLSLSYDLQKTYRSLEYSQQQKSYKKYIFQKQNFFDFFPSYHRYFRVRIRSKSKSFFGSIKNCVRFQSFVYVNLLFRVFFGTSCRVSVLCLFQKFFVYVIKSDLSYLSLLLCTFGL